MRRRLLLAVVGLGVAAMCGLSGVSSAATVVNGGFETGDLNGWTVVNQQGSSGDWYVYTGTNTPASNVAIAAPPEGTHAAVTDQFSQGSYVLYQDVALEARSTHRLSLQVYYENRAPTGSFVTQPHLDYGIHGVPNQQYRVDILRPSAPVTSVAPGDVLATLFRTNSGDPPSLAPTPVSVDLSGFAGTTVRIRVAAVASLGPFHASVDAVAVTSTRAVPTTKDQCKNDGWQTFGTSFKNQGDCVSFVTTEARGA